MKYLEDSNFSRQNKMMVARRSRERAVKSPGFQFFLTKRVLEMDAH